MSASLFSRSLSFYALSGAVLALALLGGACARSGSTAGPKTHAKGTDTTAVAAPIQVTTAPAVGREVPSFIQATGSLVAQETSDVAPQTSGQVVMTPVNVGAFVAQGAVIARLNDRDARLRLQQAQAGVQQAVAAVRQAEARLGLRPGGNFDASAIPEVRAANANLQQALAQLQLAEANERRYRSLVESGDTAVSLYDQYRTTRDTAAAQVNNMRQQLEAAVNIARQSNQAIQSAEAGVAAARSQVSIAQKAVTDSVVRSPYSGYVSNRPIAVGEYVTPASTIATLLRTNPLKLQILVPEADAPFITPGMSVSLEVDAHRDRKFSGQVTAVNPAIDPVSRSATIEAAVENGDNALRAGMFATVRILRKGGGQSVFVPRTAVFNDQNTQSYRVFVIQDGVAKLRVVQIGDQEGETVQILSGVNADEIVATSNIQQLFEGARVKQ
jgi:multidrug efflux pump subunit AcrA (membrane-fusion protein)